jgi:two-component system CheB/CheR fusion protein
MTPTAVEDPALEDLLAYIKRARGFDFTGYKRTTLGRRIHKRMQEVSLEEYPDYLDVLEAAPEEFDLLFNTILINITRFFRDPPVWDYIQHELVPRIVGETAPDSPIRVWSAGCATGEEAYTLAMVLAQALGEKDYLRRVKIFATDVDEEELDTARHAVYSEKQVASVPEGLLNRFFERAGTSHIFRKDLRRSVIFGRNDLARDAPISRLNLLTCRNTLMYFNGETQNAILRRLHLALLDGSYLALGKSEMLLAFSDAFESMDLGKRVFRKVPGRVLRPLTPLPGVPGYGADAPMLSTMAHLRASFAAAPVAQVVIDEEGVVVLANERLRSLFGVSAADIGRPLQDLQLSYRPIELRSLIDNAQGEAKPVHVADVSFKGPDGSELQLEVDVAPLLDGDERQLGTSISFLDVTQYRRVWEELQQSKRDLEAAYEELQSTVEELETTNEELQSTNEELETTNEELQSTNEELETMNEELQSSNEELETTNEELRIRTGELNYANTLMESMLASLGVAVAIVDHDLRIQMWNDRAKEMWGVDSADVRGQHVLDLDIGLPVERLRDPLRKCLAGKRKSETTLQIAARDRRGKDILCSVRCAPLRGPDGTIEGAIVLMEALAAAPAGMSAS